MVSGVNPGMCQGVGSMQGPRDGSGPRGQMIRQQMQAQQAQQMQVEQQNQNQNQIKQVEIAQAIGMGGAIDITS